ncbi:MAG: aminopeptidase P family protein [bacterium]|nr:aminopeptidase P family protein [bacterium]
MTRRIDPVRVSLLGVCLITCVLTSVAADQSAEVTEPGAVLAMSDRIEPVNKITKQRLDELLPRVMHEAGLDMWLVINREYNEDPTYLTLVPEPAYSARRLTILLFFDRGGDQGVERINVGRNTYRGLYVKGWDGGEPEEQWQRLAELIKERDPQRIGINVSRSWAFADGLSVGLKEQLEEALGEDLSERLTGAEDLVIRWLETRTPAELEVYPHIVGLARGVIAEAFSDRVITPGVTTTSDVSAYMLQRFSDLNLRTWFPPWVDVQHPETPCNPEEPICTEDGVIRPGDLLHTDVGICYLRLCTDTQEMGYVLRLGESAPPDDLLDALAVGNRWQDLHTDQFRSGYSGNEILEKGLVAMAEAGITGSIYSHPLGMFGHGPGPIIGLWDKQEVIPVRGEWLLYPNTAYAIEGNVKVAAPDWSDQLAQIKLEQSAYFDGEKVIYLAGRQTAWHLIGVAETP